MVTTSPVWLALAILGCSLLARPVSADLLRHTARARRQIPFEASDPLPEKAKLYFAGSGSAMFSEMETAMEVIDLSGKPEPNVLYIGTASYDKASTRETQTSKFVELGCTVWELAISYMNMSEAAMASKLEWADVVLISGGNTNFATRRWSHIGLDRLIVRAGLNGRVLAGGSAGAIVWFDGGHSDSMDPTTYKNPPGPILNPELEEATLGMSWSYIRTPGLGIVPGIFCPHYDVTQSNGILRADSFADTLRAHSGEYGIALDNWAALRIEYNQYQLIKRAGKSGSHDPNGEFTTDFDNGEPGGWQMYVDQLGSLVRMNVATAGDVSLLFRKSRYILQDQILPVAALQNPDDGFEPAHFQNNSTL